MRKCMTSVAVAVVVLACVSGVQANVVMETVSVGNPGNAGENSGESEPGGAGPDRICGAVEYVYNIGTFEVTAGQYIEFLNAVADDDAYGLYDEKMDLTRNPEDGGCNIVRSGSSPNFSYSVAGDWADRPVNYVSWGDAARFANWLHNGQPTGAQGPGTTEDGSYYLDGTLSRCRLLNIEREPAATWVIPSEDEWYKAAYHKNDGVTGNYWDYPTESDMPPTSEPPPGTDMTNGSANYYDYYDNEWAIGPPYYRTGVGAYDAKPSDSPYGTFDQGGNVWEWNETILYDEMFALCVAYRGLRGGAFSSNTENLHAANRFVNGPPLLGSRVGFRVAEVSEHAAVPEDLDHDGDVDLNDYRLLQAAFTGPR